MIRIPQTLLPPKYDKSKYKAWGNLADLAAGQGWYPETTFNGETTYRSNYNPVFNNVLIPKENSYGHIALIGRDNQKFDVVIRDKTGNIKQYISKYQSPEQVQAYITSMKGNVGQRNSNAITADRQGGQLPPVVMK